MPLPNDAVDKLRLFLVSSVWTEVIEPALAKRAHGAIKALVQSPAEREGENAKVTDETLRARIRESEWMLTVWRNEVALADMERRQINELESRDGGGNVGDPTGQ